MTFLEALQKCLDAKKKHELLGMRPTKWGHQDMAACAYTIQPWERENEWGESETMFYLVFVARGTLRTSSDMLEGATHVDAERTVGSWLLVTEEAMNKEYDLKWKNIRAEAGA